RVVEMAEVAALLLHEQEEAGEAARPRHLGAISGRALELADGEQRHGGGAEIRAAQVGIGDAAARRMAAAVGLTRRQEVERTTRAVAERAIVGGAVDLRQKIGRAGV